MKRPTRQTTADDRRVVSFADPLLSGTVVNGTWDPVEWRWPG